MTLWIRGEPKTSTKSVHTIDQTIKLNENEIYAMDYGTCLKKTLTLDAYPCIKFDYTIYCHRNSEGIHSYSITLDSRKHAAKIIGWKESMGKPILNLKNL